MENYIEAVFQGIVRGVTSYFVQKKLEIIERKEKTIQSPGKQKDDFKEKE